MNETITRPQSGQISDAGAAAIGGGGAGTLLVGIAQFLPEDSKWRLFLVVAAPSVSVILSNLWMWATKELKERRKRKDIEEAYSTARRHLKELIEDPTTPPTMKEKYQERLTRLEDKWFSLQMEVMET